MMLPAVWVTICFLDILLKSCTAQPSTRLPSESISQSDDPDPWVFQD